MSSKALGRMAGSLVSGCRWVQGRVVRWLSPPPRRTGRARIDTATRAFDGTIARINPQSQAGSRSIMVYVEVPNTSGDLKGGMFAKGAITLKRRDNVIAVPITALREERGETVVYAIEGGVKQAKFFFFFSNTHWKNEVDELENQERSGKAERYNNSECLPILEVTTSILKPPSTYRTCPVM